MRSTTLMGILAGVITLSTIAPSFAEGPGGVVALSPSSGPKGAAQCGPGGGPRGFFQQLNLTDDQLEKFHAIRTKYATETAAKQAELKVLRIQLREALSAEKIDKQAAFAINSKINALKADLSNARLASMIEKADVFTPEQRKEMHHRMLQREAGGGRGHGHHGWGGRHHG